MSDMQMILMLPRKAQKLACALCSRLVARVTPQKCLGKQRPLVTACSPTSHFHLAFPYPDFKSCTKLRAMPFALKHFIPLSCPLESLLLRLWAWIGPWTNCDIRKLHGFSGPIFFALYPPLAYALPAPHVTTSANPRLCIACTTCNHLCKSTSRCFKCLLKISSLSLFKNKLDFFSLCAGSDYRSTM